MPTLSRRKLLISAALPAITVPITSLASAVSTSQNKELNPTSRNEEFAQVYQSWVKQDLGEPKQYLETRLSLSGEKNLDATLIQKLSKEDFKNGLIIDIHGLKLSKFEAAYIANMGAV